jgi:hypothetical protein
MRPPHFHALYGEHEALVDIGELRVMRGSLPRRAMALVLEWATEHRHELMELEPMSTTASPEADRAAEVVPSIRHTVPWRVVSVVVLPEFRLRVTFVEGATGEVDMGALLGSAKVDGTVFEALRDPALFARAEVVLGAVQWPNGADLAPDAMYDSIREHGVWTLD